MTRRVPPLNALRVFEAAARWLSFTKAAHELHVTQGAVSRQVKLLEEFLGIELFDRTPHGVELSPAGKTYSRTLTHTFEEILRATDSLRNPNAQAVLTIRGYTTFIVRWLTPRLPDFHVRHPNIEVRLQFSTLGVDFQRDKVDLGILYGYGHWNGLHSDMLLKDDLLPVCSPTFRDQLTLETPADLVNCPLLRLNRRRRDWSHWFKIAGIKREPQPHDLDFDDLGVLYQCTISGLGVAMGQREYLTDDLASGRLVAPFELALRRQMGFYLVCPNERADMAKIETFRAWLIGTMTQQETEQSASQAG